jgi:peroxiredoxin
MKKIATLLITAAIIVSCSSEERYKIKGKIKDSDGITFYLKISDGVNFIDIDSAVSQRGSFTMKGGAVEHPQVAALVAGNTNRVISFYLENSKITIKGSIDSLFKANITGSKTHDEYKAYIESNIPLGDAYQSLYVDFMAITADDDSTATIILSKIDSLEKELIKNQKEFIINNPASYVTPSFLLGLSGDMSADELETYIINLDSVILNLPSIAALKNRVAAIRSVEIGAKAPDFTLNDVDDNPVSLYSKIGAKALLIDFWAAWCAPCRLENPNIVKVYKEFNKKGFDIIGVSLDRSREDWIKAIETDSLKWTNVSDINGWDNPVAALYAVSAIPANFLLDTTGIIIAKNLRGEELFNKVKEVIEAK